MDFLTMEERINIRRWFRTNRIKLFYVSLFLSSFLTFISTQGFFNLFFYALLVMIIVNRDEERYEELPLPGWDEIAFGVFVCASSFLFDIFTRGIFGGGYGQTDYTILVVGLIFLFFGYRNMRVIIKPILLVGGLFLTLQGLRLVYENFFDPVANWFVNVITKIAGPEGLGYPVYSGEEAGVFVVHGRNEIGALKVDWGCTGLRSLGMFSFILVALIWPMALTWWKKAVGIVVGVVGAFIINILRMVMLALIMYYRDMQTTLLVHKHLGDFLFVIWMVVFWWVFFKYFEEEEPRETGI